MAGKYEYLPKHPVRNTSNPMDRNKNMGTVAYDNSGDILQQFPLLHPHIHHNTLQCHNVHPDGPDQTAYNNR
jgi:hypothetical protein